MEFLIGRSLANNVTNLLLDPVARRSSRRAKLDWTALLEQEPDAGLGNGGLGRLAACFIDSLATLQLPAIGYGLRYEYGIFRQTIKDGWQVEQPDNWLRPPDPWEVARPQRSRRGQAGLLLRAVAAATLRAVPGQPSTPARHPVRPPGRRLRRQDDQHAAAVGGARRRTTSISSEFSSGDFVGAAGRDARRRVAHARALSRRFDRRGAGACASCRSISSSPARWPTSSRRFRRRNTDWNTLPDKVAIQLNDTHPALAVAELMRILLDEARLGWDEAWDI